MLYIIAIVVLFITMFVLQDIVTDIVTEYGDKLLGYLEQLRAKVNDFFKNKLQRKINKLQEKDEDKPA